MNLDDVQLTTAEFNPYYEQYIVLAPDTNIVSGLKQCLEHTIQFFKNIPEEKHNYRYADGKWTVKEILLHIIDVERIFSYRALRIARQDKTPLPGFEQDDYVLNADVSKRTLEDLLQEYSAVKQATIHLFNSFHAATLKSIGEASNSPTSVRAIGYIIQGHETHHKNVIESRYL